MSRLPAAALALGLPVGLVAAIDRLGESPAGLAVAVAALFGALAIAATGHRARPVHLRRGAGRGRAGARRPLGD